MKRILIALAILAITCSVVGFVDGWRTVSGPTALHEFVLARTTLICVDKQDKTCRLVFAVSKKELAMFDVIPAGSGKWKISPAVQSEVDHAEAVAWLVNFWM